jgi:hypothetical protein
MAEPDLDGAVAGGKFSEGQALARDDRIEKLSPLLSRRRSRKRPRDDVGLAGVCGAGVDSCEVSMNMAALHLIRALAMIHTKPGRARKICNPEVDLCDFRPAGAKSRQANRSRGYE